MSFQKNPPRPSGAKHLADRLKMQSASGLLFTLTAGGLPPHTFVVAGSCTTTPKASAMTSAPFADGQREALLAVIDSFQAAG
ncbi:hypothetical protein [Photorhabdus viridis]|uniref:hypothetical protein n=1 Tax=Photorhabdus viridis TaxID=3163327 RepID=UPI003307330A